MRSHREQLDQYEATILLKGLEQYYRAVKGQKDGAIRTRLDGPIWTGFGRRTRIAIFCPATQEGLLSAAAWQRLESNDEDFEI